MGFMQRGLIMDDCVKIPLLLKGEIVAYALISRCDYEEVNKHKWHLNPSGYAARLICTKIAKRKYATKRQTLHRFLLNVTDKNIQVDHINLDRLDDQRENLRLATHGENMFNKNMYSNNKSGYKGVYFKDNSYRAEIGYKEQNICLGSYKIKEDAALAYNLAAIKYFGEFAALNDLDLEFVKNNTDRITAIIDDVGKPKGSVKYRGVWFNKRTGKYVAETRKDSVKYYGGEYSDSISAAVAYNNLAIKIHGDKAILNEGI